MPIRVEISREEIEPYLNRDYWGFGNKILYEMVKHNSRHTDADIIGGKLWLIGRAYAAPIERNKATYDRSKGDFYYVKAVPKMLEIGQELDERIDDLKKQKTITSSALTQILDTHAYLVKKFEYITVDNKRSLASKYLHFHAPNMFYIYDSRAEKASTKYVHVDRSFHKKLKSSANEEWDDGYTKFVVRLYELQEYIQDRFGQISPRALDSFLLKFNYYN